ncbi:ATG13 [Candida pseudojiufengensis]|uniref:ATG13 n=1 Tax=Candida pseudojiufengensis TaxID=497109 RepID=UPI0022255CDA|nr:ATG13 [Candida pseudojiufengensis]KAI5966708.1 ATG13 [Candida pseudojiufengensis]
MSVDQNLKHQSESAAAKKQTAKLTQVLINFFTKAAQIILDSRSDSKKIHSPYNDDEIHHKINKWFNLHMISSTKEDLKLWKSSDLTSIPPMIIETYLDLRQLPSNQTLVLFDDEKHPWTVAKSNSKKQEVVLERWLIEFDQRPTNLINDELPTIYKQAIILFRTIYGYSRLMPSYKLKLKQSNKLSLGNKILDGNQPISSKGRIGLSKPIIELNESHTTQKFFTPINTSLGTLKISIAYRNHYDFNLHEHEEVLSVHFTKHDEDIKNKLSSLSPCSSLNSSKDHNNISFIKETSTSPKRSSTSPAQKVPIVPVQQIPNQNPNQNQNQPTSNIQQSTSLERKISITSSKSISNASLAAFLRNPRSNTPSTNNIPIINNNNNNNNPYSSSFPRSISSSTGNDDSIFQNPDSTNNTPRFSSSFGSRASRRFSNTSIRQHTPSSDYFNQSNNSVDAALSGLYMDDDINDFVRMIDSKSDLKLSGGSNNTNESFKNKPIKEVIDDDDLEDIESRELQKYQNLRDKYSQLGDSVNAGVKDDLLFPMSDMNSR